MTPNAKFCSADTTAAVAAQTMASDDIGAVAVCDTNGRLQGVITDRDLALKIVAARRDPATVRLRNLSTEAKWSPSAPTTASKKQSAP